MPASFVVRIGEFGGYMIVETDNPTDIHYVTSVFAVFEFKVEPVVDVMDAVAVEVKAIEYRKKTPLRRVRKRVLFLRARPLFFPGSRGVCSLKW